MSDFLKERRTGLEEAFFAEQDAILRRRMAEEDQKNSTIEALSAASGIKDRVVLDKLLALNISVTTLTALAMVPMVLVAWADDRIDPKERDAVLSGAEQVGLHKDDVGYQLLKGWLAQRPPAALADTWKSYVTALSASLDHEARGKLKADLLDRAKTVAEAAGGFLGLLKSVSPAEKAVLDDLERAFGSA